MSLEDQEKEFQSILAALGERELTDWERERLWELLEGNPERISAFSDHCFVGARSNQRRLGARSFEQTYGFGHQRFAGTGLAGEGSNARAEQHRSFFDDT